MKQGRKKKGEQWGNSPFSKMFGVPVDTFFGEINFENAAGHLSLRYSPVIVSRHEDALPLP